MPLFPYFPWLPLLRAPYCSKTGSDRRIKFRLEFVAKSQNTSCGIDRKNGFVNYIPGMDASTVTPNNDMNRIDEKLAEIQLT
jgi:hypothetical protein